MTDDAMSKYIEIGMECRQLRDENAALTARLAEVEAERDQAKADLRYLIEAMRRMETR